MLQLQQKVNKLFHVFLEKVFGAETVLSFFSYNGKIGRNQFFCLMILIGLCVRSLSAYVLLKYVVYLLSFYVVLAAVQKRCRDFGSQGTLYLVVYTVCYFVFTSNYFIAKHDIPMPWVYLYLIVIIVTVIMQVIAFIVLSYKVSKPDADANLCSPLLKYPLLYVGVCWVLMIAGTLAVNHFAGIEVALF